MRLRGPLLGLVPPLLLAVLACGPRHVAANPLGSGGVITNDGPDILRHTFNTSGTFTALGSIFVQVAVLGGGGAGCGDACTYMMILCGCGCRGEKAPRGSRAVIIAPADP